MTKDRNTPSKDGADPDRFQSPDRYRNDKALWKDQDMPDAEHTATPQDYERLPPGRDRR